MPVGIGGTYYKVRGGQRHAAFIREARQLRDMTIDVGLFGEDRYPNGMSVAAIATINEFGSRKARIPERAFFRGAVRDMRTPLKYLSRNELSRTNRRVVRGIRSFDNRVLSSGSTRRIGNTAVEHVQISIIRTLNPPNAPSVAKSKARSGQLPNPLVATRFMHDHVKFKVK